MRKLFQSTDFDRLISKPTPKSTKNDYQDVLLKYKNSSPMIFGEFYRSNTPIQLQLSPINVSQKSCFSIVSDNIDFSVKEKGRKFDNTSQQSLDWEPEGKKIETLLIKEQIISEEQINSNKRLKEIRLNTNKKLEQLDNCNAHKQIEYLQQRQQILQKLKLQIGQYEKFQQPLKSALKKKGSCRRIFSQKTENELDYSNDDDWQFIMQAKTVLQKQKSQHNFDEEMVTPSKVRFKSKKPIASNESFSVLQFRY